MDKATLLLEDGTYAGLGDRVFNYYDGKWGVIITPPKDYDGWVDVRHDDGTQAFLNGQRMASYNPKNLEEK